MTNPRIWLRAASGLLVFFALAHTAGHLMAKFDALELEKKHLEMYQGFSLFMSVHLLMLAFLTWYAAQLSQENPRLARKMAIVLFVGSIPVAVICWMKFFAAPAITSTIIAACLGMALHTLSKRRENPRR